MVDRRIAWLVGLVALQCVLLITTLRVRGLGDPAWHHAVSLVVALAACAAFWRPLSQSRRFLAMGVLAFTVLATASGFWLLYWKEGLRADGLQDWGRFWHVLWSWFATVFFFQHVWINRRAYWRFVRRSVATPSGTLLHVGAYVLVAVAFVVTWTRLGSGWFTNDNYIPLSLYAWLAFAVPPYLLWIYVRSALSFPFSRALVARLFDRRRVQVWFSVALVPVAALAILSGVPLVFMKDLVESGDLKYVSKYWHVWPSALFAVLVFGHSVHSWQGVLHHWSSFAPAPQRGRPRKQGVVDPPPPALTASTPVAGPGGARPPGRRTVRRTAPTRE